MRSLAVTDPGFAVDILDDVLSSYEEVMERLDSLLYQDALRRVARVLDIPVATGEISVTIRRRQPTVAARR